MILVVELLELLENLVVKVIVDEVCMNFNVENEKVIVDYILFILDG